MWKRFLTTIIILAVIGVPLVSLHAESIGPSSPTVDLGPLDLGSLNGEAARPIYLKGKVVSVRESSGSQVARVRLLDGMDKNREVTITIGELGTKSFRKVQPGNTIVVVRSQAPNGAGYSYVDQYRSTSILVVALLFVVLAALVGRRRGITSVVGLAFSIAVIAGFMIPAIIHGANPFLVIIVSAAAIAVISLYLSHGFNRRTTIALIATLSTLVLAVLSSYLFVWFAKLSGVGSEEALSLQVGVATNLDLRGLLLGGIIIGALGVLDDITTAQTAVVGELHSANPQLSRRELFARGLIVGREHIASLVNTLALAYVGASLPLFLLLGLHPNQPLWVTLNSETIMEEVVRTLAGSTALVLAVPISTFLASYYAHHSLPFSKALSRRPR